MVKPPEHPLGFAFEQARDWTYAQERALTETQRRVYDGIKSRQTLERRQHQERIDAVRAQLTEQAKNKKLKAELVLNPPALVKDPYIRRHARNVIAAEKRLERLDRQHAAELMKVLKVFEQEREQHKSKPRPDFAQSWAQALQKTARQERSAKERGPDLSDDFGKAR